MTQVLPSKPMLVRLGAASSVTRAVDDVGQREFMGAQTYWL